VLPFLQVTLLSLVEAVAVLVQVAVAELAVINLAQHL
jgi:hypothetical protein